MQKNFIENKQAAADFDSVLTDQLKKRLKREPTPSEIINADNDSDLVNETLWQMVNGLYDRLEALEAVANPKKK